MAQVTRIIGVITPDERRFRLWKEENVFSTAGGVEVVRITTMDNLSGREFVALMYGFDHCEVDSKVIHFAKLRLR